MSEYRAESCMIYRDGEPWVGTLNQLQAKAIAAELNAHTRTIAVLLAEVEAWDKNYEEYEQGCWLNSCDDPPPMFPPSEAREATSKDPGVIAARAAGREGEGDGNGR